MKGDLHTARGRAWVRLDNASNIFLAARSDYDSKVFRFSAEMDREVDEALLQHALDHTYDRYPLYHAVLRRGIFWYYLQDSDLRPVAAEEDLYTCAPIYQPGRRNLLFRVVHHGRRISLEVFHALSDGTGALWFFTDLLEAYATLRATGELPAGNGGDEDESGGEGAGAGARVGNGVDVGVGERAGEGDQPRDRDLTRDSFAEYFFEPTKPLATRGAPPLLERRSWRGVFRPRGTRTPDHRMRVVELAMPSKQVIQLARAEGVSLTAYLTALFFESFRAGGLGNTPTLAASVPVNLRQFFPSTSARNFFATIRLTHTYSTNEGDGERAGEDDFGAVCRSLEAQLRAGANPDALEQKVRRLVRLERNLALRLVPRPVKDAFLRQMSRANNRGLSVAITNLGLVKFPDVAEAQVRRTLLHVAAVRPQFALISQGGVTTISFSSPFVETDHVREFARFLTERGVTVTVAATRVTEGELAEVARAGEHGPAERGPVEVTRATV